MLQVENLDYGVILTVDTASIPLSHLDLPSCVLRKMDITESDDRESEYSYLADGVKDSVWARGKHHKWSGVLSYKDFHTLCWSMGLSPEDCETMGSLGTPWRGLGLVPAISFNSRLSSMLM